MYGYAVHCTSLGGKPLILVQIMQMLLYSCRMQVNFIRTMPHVPEYQRMNQNVWLCSTLYCFGLETLDYGTNQAIVDVIMHNSCNDT
jgi:hypothetical protein